MDEVLYQEALDKTGIVSIYSLTQFDKNSITSRGKTLEWKEEGTLDIAKELLRVHEIAPGKKPEGVTRIIYENTNSFNTRISGNEKVEKAKEVIDKLEVDVVCYNKHRVNMKHKENYNGFNQLFRRGEADIISAVALNFHKNIFKVQQGGTSMLLFGSLIQQFDVHHLGKDDTGLGR